MAQREFIDNVALFLNIMIPTILRIKKKTVELQKIVFMLRFCFTISPPFWDQYSIKSGRLQGFAGKSRRGFAYSTQLQGPCVQRLPLANLPSSLCEHRDCPFLRMDTPPILLRPRISWQGSAPTTTRSRVCFGYSTNFIIPITFVVGGDLPDAPQPTTK